MSARFSIALAIGVSVIHWITYTVLWGSAFALGEGGGGAVAEGLGTAAWVLGTPLMHLLELGPSAFMVDGSRWWGDDSNLILGLSAFNAALWGTGIAWLIQLRRKRARGGSARAA